MFSLVLSGLLKGVTVEGSVVVESRHAVSSFLHFKYKV